MKPWVWIVIAAVLLIVIIYGIYAWQQSKSEEAAIERARIAAMQGGGTEEGGKTNIWALISGLTGVFAESGYGAGENKA